MNLLLKLLFMFTLFINNSCAFIPQIPICSINHISEVNPDLAISIIKTSTAILPQFDSVGHIVLSTNELLINKVLETNLDISIKKKIILNIIDLARQGDEMGGKILSNYYNLVKNIL